MKTDFRYIQSLNVNLLRGIVVAIFLLASCTFEESEYSPSNNQEDNGTIALLDTSEIALLERLGFTDISYVEEGKVVVEGDIVFNRKDLRRILSDEIIFATTKEDTIGGEKQYAQSITSLKTSPRINGPVYLSHFPLSFRIGPGFNPLVVTAIRDAFNDWTAITNCENFREANPGEAEDITVVLNNALNAVGRGEFPLFGNPGSLLEINEVSLLANIQAAGWRRVIAHEIGHVVGFRHADAMTNGEPSDYVFLHGTTLEDVNSVMTSGPTQFLLQGPAPIPANAFNADDERAARMLYPLFQRPFDNVSFDVYKSPFSKKRYVDLSVQYQADAPYYQIEVCWRQCNSSGVPYSYSTEKCSGMLVVEENEDVLIKLSEISGNYFRIWVTAYNYGEDFAGITFSDFDGIY